MSFDLDRNSWKAFLSGARRQVSCLTRIKGLCDPTDAVKLALNGPPVRCAMNSESLARLSKFMAHLTGGPFRANLTASVGSHRPLLAPLRNACHEFRSRSKLMVCVS